MLNFKAQTRKIFVITFGIFISVLIYYLDISLALLEEVDITFNIHLDTSYNSIDCFNCWLSEDK